MALLPRASNILHVALSLWFSWICKVLFSVNACGLPLSLPSPQPAVAYPDALTGAPADHGMHGVRPGGSAAGDADAEGSAAAAASAAAPRDHVEIEKSNVLILVRLRRCCFCGCFKRNAPLPFSGASPAPQSPVSLAAGRPACSHSFCPLLPLPRAPRAAARRCWPRRWHASSTCPLQ